MFVLVLSSFPSSSHMHAFVAVTTSPTVPRTVLYQHSTGTVPYIMMLFVVVTWALKFPRTTMSDRNCELGRSYSWDHVGRAGRSPPVVHRRMESEKSNFVWPPAGTQATAHGGGRATGDGTHAQSVASLSTSHHRLWPREKGAKIFFTMYCT